MGTIRSWGLHTQVQPRFGARAIVELSRVSLLWDRSATYDGADDQKHDINQVMLTIDIRAGFFDKGKMFNQGHGARLLHGGVIRSQTIGLFEFP